MVECSVASRVLNGSLVVVHHPHTFGPDDFGGVYTDQGRIRSPGLGLCRSAQI